MNAHQKAPAASDSFLSLPVGAKTELRLIVGDITKYTADAIVNAAHSELLTGGGVCGAIHRVGGPAIAGECHRIRAERGPVAPGQAVATTGGQLPAKYVIHAVGPIWQGGEHHEAETLASCYRESLRIADELGLRSIAFPAISTGSFGYPLDQAANVAIATLIAKLPMAKNIVIASMVLFDQETFDVFRKAAVET